jgi:hypothetical protein
LKAILGQLKKTRGIRKGLKRAKRLKGNKKGEGDEDVKREP